MQITDEMVREASKAYNDYVIGCPTQAYLPHAMRAALEAALLAQRNTPAFNIVRDMKGPSEVIACIEAFAGALKKTNARLYTLCDCKPESGCAAAILREKNRVTLERWGLK